MEVDEGVYRRMSSEHADMSQRLKAIYDIVGGGEVPAASRPRKPVTDGCNCNFDGVLDRALHQFGCPYGTNAPRPMKTL